MLFSIIFTVLSAASALATPIISESPSIITSSAMVARGLHGAKHRYDHDCRKDRIKQDLRCMGEDIHHHLSSIKYEIKGDVREWKHEVKQHIKKLVRWIRGQWQEFDREFDRFQFDLERYLKGHVRSIAYDIHHFWFHDIIYIWTHLDNLADNTRYELSYKLNELISLIAMDNGWSFSAKSNDCGYLLTEFELLVSYNPNYINLSIYQAKILDIHKLVYYQSVSSIDEESFHV